MRKRAQAAKHPLGLPWRSAAGGVALCQLLEPVCLPYGYHVALGGGLATKKPPRKDCDLIFYRHAGFDDPDPMALLHAIKKRYLSISTPIHDRRLERRVFKATFYGKSVDLIFPEHNGGYK